MMKIIKLFLLWSLVLWADISLQTPRCVKYKTIQSVLNEGWKDTDQNLTTWVRKNGEQYIIDFQKVVKVPLRRLTDEEYLQKQLDSYEETKKFFKDLNYDIRNKDDYKKRYELEMKHGIYYNYFTKRVDPETYRYVLVMIKYLESQKKYEQSYVLYAELLQRLIDDIKIHGYSFLEITIWEFKEKELFGSLKNSLLSNIYTKEQKSEISELLSELMPINEKAYIEIMKYERELAFTHLYIGWIENKSLDDYAKYDAQSMKNAMKVVDSKVLKRFFEDKAVMNKVFDAYKRKFNVIYNRLLKMKSKNELDLYTAQMERMKDNVGILDNIRLYLLIRLDKVGLHFFSKMFQYKFSEDEFVEIVSQFTILTGKPWVLGKYKFEWEELVKENEALLELSKK